MAAAEVWFAYFALGGMEPPKVIDSILEGTVAPTDRDYDLLAQALNERFMDRGTDHPVPYGDEL